MKKYRFLSLLLVVLMALSLTAPAAALEENGLSLFSCGLTRGARLQTLTYEDAFSGVYKRLFLEDGKIVGGILFGDTSQAGQLLNWVASRRQAPASILES